MKIRIATALACIGLMAFVSCSQDIDIETGMEENDGISKAIVSSCDFEASADYSQSGTRSTLDPTGTATTFAWAEGDIIGVYAGDGDGMMNFNLNHMADNKKEAIFKATGFNLANGNTYYAFSPYDGNSNDKTQVEINYDGIRQVANGGYAHLGKYDYQWAKATAQGSTEAANIVFNFEHAGAICRFRINNLPQGMAFDKMTISNDYIITKGTMNLATPTIDKAITGNSTTQTVMLGAEDGNGITADSDGRLTVYTMMAPVNLSGKTIAVSLYEKGKSASTYLVSGKNMLAGGAHGFSTSGDYVDLGVTDGSGKSIMWARYNAAIPSAGNSYISFFNHADAVDAGTAVWKTLWGGRSWRLPSKADFKALKDQTYSVWVTEYNGVAVSGRIFYKVKNDNHKGKIDLTHNNEYDYSTDTDVHIFLPAAYNTGHGIYWTSDADTENTGKSHYFDIYNAEPYYFSTGSNTEMFSVRPVFTQN